MNVLIIGDIPRFVGVEASTEFHDQLTAFLEQRGCNVHRQNYNAPVDMTDVDLVVTVGKGSDTLEAVRLLRSVDSAVELACHGGLSHPVAHQWFNEGAHGKPPLELYAFTADQKLALENAIKAIAPTPIVAPSLTRQSASRRPGVR